MTLLQLPGAASFVERLADIVARQRIEAIVHTGCGDGALTHQLAGLGLPIFAIDARPDAVAATKARLAGQPARASCLQGHPPRVLADLRCQLPERTLYVLASSGLPESTVRDEMFWAKPGAGVIAVVSDAASKVRLADVQDQLLRWSPDHHTETYALDGQIDGSRTVLVALPRPRVHVTFLIEKYSFDYGKSGISINLDNLVATLDESGLATFNVVHYDQCFHEGRRIPLEEISKPADADVHVVVCTMHYHSRANPKQEELLAAKATGSRIAFVWLDKMTSRSTPEFSSLADLNVVLDGNDFQLPNAWPIYTPKNPRFFHDSGLERDMDISLVGEVRYLTQRRAMVDRLETESRIPVTMCPTSAADTGLALSVAEYARLYQRSKISLALTKDSVRQLKGRVFEILHCGAMLLCDRNHHVSHYLRPGVEYVTYADYEDLVRKARYYLDHDDERVRIARAGHARCKSHYDHATFWKGLLARLGGSASAFYGA